MAVQTTGKKKTESLEAGQLIAQTIVMDGRYMDQGQGKITVNGIVRTAEGEFLQCLNSGYDRIQVDFAQVIGRTYSTGITGQQLLETIAEVVELVWDGTIPPAQNN